MTLVDWFGPLLGTWAGAEELASAPSSPATTTRAMLVLKLALADSVVLQDYRQVRADGEELTAHGVFLVTDVSPPGIGWWLFDSRGAPPREARGGWQGPRLVLERPSPDGVARHVLVAEAATLTYDIDVRLGRDTAFRPFLRGRYARVSGH